MTDNEVSEAKRAYYRDWKAKKKDKVRESNKRYWAKYAACKAAEKPQGAKDDDAATAVSDNA